MARKTKSEKATVIKIVGPERVDAVHYEWKELWGLTAVTDFTRGTKSQRSVVVENAEKIKKYFTGSYGSRFQYIEESVQFDDGRILLAASVSEWAGTFASHDDIRIRYFGLTPK